MKILMFVSNPVNGGTVRMFHELYRTMKKLLPDDEVVAAANEGNPAELVSSIADIKRLPVRSKDEIFGAYPVGESLVKRFFSRTTRDSRYHPVEKENIRILSDYLKENRFDAVIIHNGGYVGDDLCNQMLIAAKLAKVKRRVMIFHNDFYKNLIQKQVYRSYDNMINDTATDLVTVSEYTKNRILSSSYIKLPIRVIYNGITVTHTLSPSDKEKRIPLDETVKNVLMIGNFARVKGHITLLEAAHILRDEYAFNDFAVTIIGNIYERDVFDECTEYIAENDLKSHVSVYHGIYNAGEYADMFDVLAVPSLCDESFGLISVEAMSAGTPIVSTDNGGIPEVVRDGIDGLVVPVNEPYAFAEALRELLTDDHRRDCMAGACKRDYMERFTPETMTLEYIKLLKKDIP